MITLGFLAFITQRVVLVPVVPVLCNFVSVPGDDGGSEDADAAIGRQHLKTKLL